MSTAYQKKWPLYLSTKNTILKVYDGRYLLMYLFHPYIILFKVIFVGWRENLCCSWEIIGKLITQLLVVNIYLFIFFFP